MEFEKLKEGLRGQIKDWKSKFEQEKSEKDFFHKQALEAKRKNKLLKIAVGRL
jgi:cell division protein FtsL